MFDIDKYLLQQLHDKYKDLPFLINDKRYWNFGEFFNEAYNLSNSLCTLSKKKIGLCSDNSEFLILAMMAACMQKRIVIPLNPRFPPKQKDQLLKKVKCDVIFSENYIPKDFQSQEIRELPRLNLEIWSTIVKHPI